MLAQGPRVHLRRLAEADLAAFQAYRGDAEVGRWQGWEPMAEVEARGFLRAMAGDPLFVPGTWTQVAIDAGAGLVGDIGVRIEADGHAAELGITLAARAQGKGLAAEALGLAFGLVFARTGVARIVAITDARNLPCLALLRRVGMVEDGTEEAWFRGEPCVEHVFRLERAGGGDRP